MSYAFSVVGEGALALRFPSFDAAGALAVLSTRVGGVSGGPFRSLNLGEGTGDDPARVAANRRRLLAGLGLEGRRLVRGVQVHGAAVRQVAADAPERIPDTDALWTAERSVVLAVSVADCVPVFLLAPELPAVGVAHAGWRGTLAGVTLGLLEGLEAAGARRAEVLAAVGPGAGGWSYVVGEEVAAAFRRAYPFGEAHLRPVGAGRHALDLVGLNRELLVRAGVPETHIAQTPYTTIDHPALFYSYRRDGRESGRMWALAALADRSPGRAGRGGPRGAAMPEAAGGAGRRA